MEVLGVYVEEYLWMYEADWTKMPIKIKLTSAFVLGVSSRKGILVTLLPHLKRRYSILPYYQFTLNISLSVLYISVIKLLLHDLEIKQKCIVIKLFLIPKGTIFFQLQYTVCTTWIQSIKLTLLNGKTIFSFTSASCSDEDANINLWSKIA